MPGIGLGGSRGGGGLSSAPRRSQPLGGGGGGAQRSGGGTQGLGGGGAPAFQRSTPTFRRSTSQTAGQQRQAFERTPNEADASYWRRYWEEGPGGGRQRAEARGAGSFSFLTPAQMFGADAVQGTPLYDQYGIYGYDF